MRLSVRAGLFGTALTFAIGQYLAFAHFVAIRPGAAEALSPFVYVEGAVQGSGRFLYTTVIVRRANLIELFRLPFDSATRITPARSGVPPGLGWSDYAESLDRMMEESHGVAAVVALREAGYRLRMTSEASGDRFEIPVEIHVASGLAAGSSAGLMLALEMYDRLTGGQLASGMTVAGTGALRLDGSIEPVLGAGQKAVAARRAGTDVFLAPRANLEEAAGLAGEMIVIPVDNFSQAIDLLRRVGGNGADL